MQARLVRKLQARACEAGQTLETVKSQEMVITKLEGLLKQAAQERRAAVATAEKLQQQLVNLESQLETGAAQVSITAFLAISAPSLLFLKVPHFKSFCHCTNMTLSSKPISAFYPGNYLFLISSLGL